MSKIQVLDQHTIDKIAAGEVIERPASVVKELVENAMDAGATAITVEIKEGGIEFIRITDNGCGIDKEEVRTAFLRHATSKIRAVEDLLSIASLGFRGEALSSIAAIARIELVTKRANALTGVQYRIEGGKETAMEEIGCPEGTTFLIRNLFYNTPARRKFLKTPATEASHIEVLLQRLALSHPDISIKYINNNQNRLYTSGNGNRKDIIYHVFGRETIQSLLPLEVEEEHVRILGYIGKPYLSRGNRSYENYFVNGRYVKSAIISQAIEKAYKTFIMVHKYPFAVLDFHIDAELIDVNVHPAKMELRFENGEELYRLIVTAIRNVLSEKELIPTVSVEKRKETEHAPAIPRGPEPFEKVRLNQMRQQTSAQVSQPIQPKVNPLSMRNKVIADPMVEAARELVDAMIPDRNETLVITDADSPNKICNTDSAVPSDQVQENTNYQLHAKPDTIEVLSQVIDPAPIAVNEQEQLTIFENKLLSEETKLGHRLIGQLFKTYWLIEFENKLFIMDQHAAHEKVLFEKLMHSFHEKDIYSQQLEPPTIVTLNARESLAFTSYEAYFRSLGFVIDAFGGDEFCIRSVPANLYGLQEKELFIEIMDSLSDEIGMADTTIITDRIAGMACKAAVKGNQKLSYTEVEALIEDLLRLENPYTCPHGRPTIIAMTQTEIEKKFKRIQS